MTRGRTERRMRRSVVALIAALVSVAPEPARAWQCIAAPSDAFTLVLESVTLNGVEVGDASAWFAPRWELSAHAETWHSTSTPFTVQASGEVSWRYCRAP
jgi:hypothetical protein